MTQRSDRSTVVSGPADGRPLDELLAADGPLGVAAVDLLRPVAEALDALHDRGIVHRDVTPAAVIVGPGRQARLRAGLEHRDAEASTTAAGAVGQAVYSAPEQAAAPVVSHRTDLYAFACVAFEAMTGTPPFTVGTIAAQLSGVVPSAAGRRPGLPGAVDDVFARALAATPTDRHPSAVAIVDALAAASGRRPGPRPAAGRRARPVVLVLGLLAAAGVAVVAYAMLAGRGPAAAADPEVRFAVAGAPIAVGAAPADVEAGEGYVWVSGSADGTITRIHPETAATTRFEVGGEPGQIVVGDGAVWVHNLGAQVTRVDAATGAVSAPIPAGGPVSGMAVGDGVLWLSHAADGTVSRVDTATLGPVGAPIAVGARPGPVELGAGAVYVLGTGDGSLTRIDTGSGEVTGTVTVGESVGGMEIDGGTVFVAADGVVVPVSEAAFTAAEPFVFGDWSYFDVADATMFVLYADQEIRRVDVATRQPVGEVVPATGAQIGRARYAFESLWMTVPEQDAVLRLAPAGGR